MPSRSSRLAPPPVEQCVTTFATLNFFAAVAVSPPPTTVTAPAAVAFAIASAMAFVPSANVSTSNTPGGPFQMIVFALLVIIFARFFREGLWGLARRAALRRSAGANASARGA